MKFAEVAENVKQLVANPPPNDEFIYALLLFCLFAEDTGIPPENAVSNGLRHIPPRMDRISMPFLSSFSTGSIPLTNVEYRTRNSEF